MAKTFSALSFLTFSLLTLSLLTPSSPHQFSKKLPHTKFGLKKEKLSHLHFYFHDIVSGRNPTAVRIAQSPLSNSSPTLFGTVAMMDDPLTMFPELSSRTVGRAQGIYASADLDQLAFLMTLNFVFTEGKYNGSTLSILGRNQVMTNVREMPVVGGSGLFRFARGYAHAHTHWLNMSSGDAVVEYNVFVLHY